MDSIYGYSAGGISNVLHTWKPNTLWRCYLQDSIFCGNSRIFVGYNASGLDLNSKNIVAQLSNANGDFSNPTNIGTFTITFPNTDPSGIITCQLPNNLNGNGYRIRVICNDPALISPDNGFDIRIQSSISPIVSLEANPSSVCDGAPVNLLAEVSAAGVNPQFAWTINGGTLNYQAESLTLDTLTLASTIGVTVTSSLACASPVTGNASTTIQVSANPPAFAGSDTTLCSGESVLLGSENGLLISWEPATGLSDATSDQPIASPESTTIYQLTVQNTEGCISYDTVQVVVNPQLPELILVNSFEILTIAEELEGTFTWYLNGEVIIDETSDSLVIFAPGDYSLQFEDAFGCTTSSNVFTVNTVATESIETTLEPIFTINSGYWQLDRIETEGNTLPVRIYDMNGRLMMVGAMNRSGESQFIIPEQTHPQGVYVFEFVNKGIPQHIKFILP